MTGRHRCWLVSVTLVSTILLVIPHEPARAATRVVTDLDDSAPGGLSNTVAAAAAGDVITFSPGLAGTITLATAPLTIGFDLEIAGPGADVLSITQGGSARAVLVTAGNVTLSGLSLRGVFNQFGGGVENHATLLLRRSRLDGNVASVGGAVWNSGTLTLDECEVTNNDGVDKGGGIYTASGSTLTIRRTTLAGNGAGSYWGGGAIEANQAEVRVANSTISENSSSIGAGMLIHGGDLEITSCTIVDNYTGGMISGTAGICLDAPNSATMRNSILVRNVNFHYPTGGPWDVNCCLQDLGYNVLSQPAPAPAIDPKLGPLQHNGGFARTRLPLAGSPAIDQGECSGLVDDQRGYDRSQDDAAVPNAAGGDGSDIGAVETGSGLAGIGEQPFAGVDRITTIAPNPARGAMSIRYALAAPGMVRVDIVGVDGRHVRTLAKRWSAAGPGVATWDGRDRRGLLPPPGVYFAVLESAKLRDARRVIVTR